MSDTGTTISFAFPNGISKEEAAIMAQAMAKLIKLNPENLEVATWRFSIDGSAMQAYELGAATAELVDALKGVARAAAGGRRKARL